MAQSVAPGDIGTHPISFKYNIWNPTHRRIAWTITAKNMHIAPVGGVLDSKEAADVSLTVDAFAPCQENPPNYRITIEWTNAPDGSTKEFKREWFEGDGLVRKRNLNIGHIPA